MFLRIHEFVISQLGKIFYLGENLRKSGIGNALKLRNCQQILKNFMIQIFKVAFFKFIFNNSNFQKLDKMDLNLVEGKNKEYAFAELFIQRLMFIYQMIALVRVNFL